VEPSIKGAARDGNSMNAYHILLVGAGGFLGSIARYITTISIDKKLNSFFPYGTLTVNLLGSFFLGVILAVVLKKSGTTAEQWKLLIGTGFCGGFTTFSAFAFENVSLFEARLAGTALIYTALSLAFGVVAVWAGMLLGRNFI
jgi:CrcB protein